MDRKSGFWSVYKDFWNRKWDFKGTSTLRELPPMEVKLNGVMAQMKPSRAR